MKIAIIGTGYVGLVSGVCFSEMGNIVTCIDINKNKIENLKKGIISIYEPKLQSMVVRNLERKNLFFSNDLSSVISNVDFIFIAVGTPIGKEGSADLQYVYAVAEEIGQKITKPLIVVNKSTVPVGTADKVRGIIQKEIDNRGKAIDFDVVSNPEFLKEGDAVSDFMEPDRIVIGANNENSLQQMKELYSSFFRTHDRFICMDIRSAEMTKYSSNAMLATKISFMNEIANICERVGADVNKVRLGVGSDTRIGYSFIYPGCGYGGSCFPKDILALKKVAEEHNYNPRLITAVDEVNNKQRLVLVDKIIDKFGKDLSERTFALWGLSFKPETDDMREAPSIYIVKELVKLGAKIKVYDPKAMEQAKSIYFKDIENVIYCDYKYDVLQNSDALILLTEWKEFRSPDFNEIKNLLKQPIIFDGRNQYVNCELEKKGIEYICIGK